MVKNSILPLMYAKFYFNTLAFVGVLEYFTHNCGKLCINQCQVNAKQSPNGSIIYCKCNVTSVRPRPTLCYMTSKKADSQSVSVSCIMCCVQPSQCSTTVCRSVIKFKTVLPHCVQINGLNIWARSLHSFSAVACTDLKSVSNQGF